MFAIGIAIFDLCICLVCIYGCFGDRGVEMCDFCYRNRMNQDMMHGDGKERSLPHAIMISRHGLRRVLDVAVPEHPVRKTTAFNTMRLWYYVIILGREKIGEKKKRASEMETGMRNTAACSYCTYKCNGVLY